MIIDSLKNSAIYETLHPLFPAAFKYLRETDLSVMEPGKYEVGGNDIFIMLSDSPLKEAKDAPLEAHDKYIDIQFVINGREGYGWRERSECTEPQSPIDTEKDVQFFNDPHSTVYELKTGEFCIFYPNDAHAPFIGEPGATVRKCIVKVKR